MIPETTKKASTKTIAPKVSISRTDTSLRSLYISFDNNTDAPKYDFKGEWTGRDAKTVSYRLGRAYRLHQRSIRLKDIKIITNKETMKKEK